jgi:4-amino-4-deoxy-L-arabinose transferase-like glycosyltransferase
MGRRAREKASRKRGEMEPATTALSPPRRAELRLPMAPDSHEIVPWQELWYRHGGTCTALFVLALAFRALVLVQTARTPFLEITNIDSASYQAWARELVAKGWWPTRNFYQSPFYAYFLGALYAMFGDGPWAPRIAQIVLGSLTPILTYGIATRLFTRRAGVVAGLLVCFYGPLVLEEVTLNKTSLLIVTAVAGVAAYLRYGPSARPGGLAVAGLLLGLTIVGVAQWLLPFAALAIYLPCLATVCSRRTRMIAVASFVGACLVPVTPIVAWNSMLGGGLVLTSGGAGLNLFSGNNERATGLPSSPPGLRDIPEYEEADARRLAEQGVGRPLTSAEVDRYWSNQAWTFIRDHPGPWLTILGRKIAVLWNAYEVPDNNHYAFLRERFIPAVWLGLTLAVVGPLALVGMLLPFWRRRGVTAFYLAWLAYMLTPLIYYVRGRYRLPLVPFLAVLAGVGIERLVRAAAARRWDHLSGLVVALVAAAVFVNHRYCEPPHHGFGSLCFADDIWFDQEWLKLAAWHQERGDLDATLAAVEQAGRCTVPRSAGQVPFRRGEVEWLKADQLAGAGDFVGAISHLQVAQASFQRCVQLRYHPEAAAQAQGRVTARIAELQNDGSHSNGPSE